MKSLTMAVLSIALSGATYGEGGRATSWVDFGRGFAPSYTTGVIHPSGWEVWDFCEPGFPMREVGRLKVVNESKGSLTLAGGYLSNWQVTDWTFAEPYAIHICEGKRSTLSVRLGAYLPLNGGPFVAYSDESSLMWKLSDRWSAGLAGSFWDEEGPQKSYKAGLKVSYVDGPLSVGFRCLPVGHGPDTNRLEVGYNF